MSDYRPPSSSPADLPRTASELNNLLHIIAGTTDLIDNIWQGNPSADKYLQMLRNSVGRAASVTAQLIGSAASIHDKVIVHPAARDRMEGFPRPSRRELKGPAPANDRRPHLLVVDDEPMALALAEQVYTLSDYRVTTAQSGFECLSIFASTPTAFALVVLDFSMPFMDGEETFDRLRTINSSVPVLLTTGYVAPEVSQRMFAHGLAGLLRKPAPPDECLEKIASILKAASSPEDRADGTALAT